MTEFHVSSAQGVNYVVREDKFVWELIPEKLSTVILSVPHDGLPARDFQGLVWPIQPNLRGLDSPAGLRDTGVWFIARGIAERTPVSVVRGMLPRYIIDYNRLWSDESRDGIDPWVKAKLCPNEKIGEELWRHYYEKLETATKRSCDGLGAERTLLLDLHGFQIYPDDRYDIVLGTMNGHTVGFDKDVSLAAHLSGCGYKVLLPEHLTEYSYSPANPYSGGNIIRQCHRDHQIDCVQVEIQASFRCLEMDYRMNWLVGDLVRFIESLV